MEQTTPHTHTHATAHRPAEALTVRRLFTRPGVHPFDTVEWELRTAAVGSFRQEDVEFPTSWSQNSTNIVAQKYFRGQLDSPDARALGQADGRAASRARSPTGVVSAATSPPRRTATPSRPS